MVTEKELNNMVDEARDLRKHNLTDEQVSWIVVDRHLETVKENKEQLHEQSQEKLNFDDSLTQEERKLISAKQELVRKIIERL